jgi:molybdopterin-guanine dinucleotide biosynthesis protein A
LIENAAAGRLSAMVEAASVGAVIVAGGRSRRMGRPKAWLELGGRFVLERVVEAIMPCCPVVVIVGSPGQALPAVPGAIRIDDPPERAHRGPLAGTLTGATALRRKGVALAYLGSVDGPLVSSAHVRYMLDVLVDDRSADAAVPVDPRTGGMHGLASAVRVGPATMAAEDLLGSGEGSMTRLFERLFARRVPADQLPDERAVWACNTPAQWRVVRESWDRMADPDAKSSSR